MKKEKKGTFGQELFELAKKHNVDLSNVHAPLLKRSWKAIWSHPHELEAKPKKLLTSC